MMKVSRGKRCFGVSLHGQRCEELIYTDGKSTRMRVGSLANLGCFSRPSIVVKESYHPTIEEKSETGLELVQAHNTNEEDKYRILDTADSMTMTESTSNCEVSPDLYTTAGLPFQQYLQPCNKAILLLSAFPPFHIEYTNFEFTKIFG